MKFEVGEWVEVTGIPDGYGDEFFGLVKGGVYEVIEIDTGYSKKAIRVRSSWNWGSVPYSTIITKEHHCLLNNLGKSPAPDDQAEVDEIVF